VGVTSCRRNSTCGRERKEGRLTSSAGYKESVHLRSELLGSHSKDVPRLLRSLLHSDFWKTTTLWPFWVHAMAHPSPAIPHPIMMTLIPEEFEGNELPDGCMMILLETSGF
jgi:hypothetical protein